MYEFFIGVIIYVALVCFFLYFCIKYEKRQTEEDTIIAEPKNDLEKQVQNSFLKMSETERARVLEKVLKKNSGNYSQSSFCQQSDDVSIIIRNKKIKKMFISTMYIVGSTININKHDEIDGNTIYTNIRPEASSTKD